MKFWVICIIYIFWDYNCFDIIDFMYIDFLVYSFKCIVMIEDVKFYFMEIDKLMEFM